MARDPFDPRQWSGSSAFFFAELRRRGCLHRAFGVEVPAWRRALYMARNFHPRRDTWREHFYMDVGYRDALTALVRRRLEPADFLALSDEALRAVGLSGAKMRYGRSLATDVVEGRIDFNALH